MGHFRLFSTPMARTGLGLLAALGVAHYASPAAFANHT